MSAGPADRMWMRLLVEKLKIKIDASLRGIAAKSWMQQEQFTALQTETLSFKKALSWTKSKF